MHACGENGRSRYQYRTRKQAHGRIGYSLFSLFYSLERDYRVGDKLGEGGFGLVLRVTRLSDKQILAIKLKICK